MNHKRTRYQHGSLTTEKRKSCPHVWIYRWREAFSDGGTINRKKIVGSLSDYPTKASALRAVDALRLEINEPVAGAPSRRAVAELVSHYCESELGEGCNKTVLTQQGYRHHITDVILPKWRDHELHQVRTVAVERWLAELPGAPATKAKTRGVLSTLFQHAIRHEWIALNPISAVRQSSRRMREPDVLTVAEIQALIDQFDGPAKVFAIMAAYTGLRRSEIIGLKWQDVDFGLATFRVVRSVVAMAEGKPKTEASRRPIHLPPQLAKVLLAWRDQSSFTQPVDWVFARHQPPLARDPTGPGCSWPSTSSQQLRLLE